jgi:hypothetical protein
LSKIKTRIAIWVLKNIENLKETPTEYDMLIDDEQTLLEELEEHRLILISLENELQVVRDKLAFIKRAVPKNIELSIHN